MLARLLSLFRRRGSGPSTDGDDDLAAVLEAQQHAARPRPQHYEFAHVALPTVAFDSGLRLLPLLLSDDRDRFLAKLWRHVHAVLVERASEAKEAPPEALPYRPMPFAPVRVGDRAAGVLTLPEPEGLVEAHAVCFVFDADADANAPPTEWDEVASLRYFTLERGLDLEADAPARRTVLCEWTPDRKHSNYGDGPPAGDARRFAEAVARLLAKQADAGPRG